MVETEDRLRILDKDEINLKIQRIAHEIHENYFNEKEIILVGIAGKGYEFASRLKKILSKFDSFDTKLVKIEMNKRAPHNTALNKEFVDEKLAKKAVLLVDDVLNSGGTLAWAVRYILAEPVKNLKTVILVNREHHAFPVTADFVGMSLATTMKEHITVEFGSKSEGVYLI